MEGVLEMRTVVIDNYSYKEFELMRDKLIKSVPYAIVNDMYSKHHKRAVFSFWDSDFIPKELEEFIVRPK